MHVSGLSNAMAAVLSLGVHCGVPVRVIEHHRVGARQVDSEAAAARGEDEAEELLVAVEAIHEMLPLLDGSSSV